jgi:hypothetical protein
MTIHFCPPIKIENLLPFDIEVSMNELSHPEKEEKGQVLSGGIIQFDTIKSDAELSISINIQLSSKFNSV